MHIHKNIVIRTDTEVYSPDSESPSWNCRNSFDIGLLGRNGEQIPVGLVILLYIAVFQNILPEKRDLEIYAIFICQTSGYHCTGQCLNNAPLKGYSVSSLLLESKFWYHGGSLFMLLFSIKVTPENGE